MGWCINSHSIVRCATGFILLVVLLVAQVGDIVLIHSEKLMCCILGLWENLIAQVNPQ